MAFGLSTKIISVIVLLGMIFWGISWVTGLRADLAVSEQNNSILQETVDTQNNTIKTLTEDFELITASNKNLTETIQKQTARVDDLHKKFNIKANGHSRDFGDIARAKPVLIERLVNKASKNVTRCFELATGAKIKENERNDECKDIIRSGTK